MKILLTNLHELTTSTGGAEKVCCDMANALSARGHQIAIAYCAEKTGRPFFLWMKKSACIT